MNCQALCMLYTQDADLSRRVGGFVGTTMEIKYTDQPRELRLALEHAGPSVLLLDVRSYRGQELLKEIADSWPEALLIVLGTPRTEPVLEARDLGVYAIADLRFDGPTMKSLVKQAMEHVRLRSEVDILQRQLAAAMARAPTDNRPLQKEPALPLRDSLSPRRRVDSVEDLLQTVIDGIANAAVVLRAGVFAFAAETATYEFKAGIGCLDETSSIRIDNDNPLVRWMEINAHIVSREGLQNMEDTAQRVMLQRALDTVGAELIVPLRGREQITGWIFLGKRSTGEPFDSADLRDITIFAEHVSTSLENAILYREVAIQKTFAETLLHSMPTGIVATDQGGTVRWFNEAAETVLGIESHDTLHHPVEKLGSRLSHHLRLALADNNGAKQPLEWQEPATKCYVAVQTSRLMSNNTCLGAVAFVHDLTRERMLNRKQRELDRASFWTELAASMSHEIRNPLVTIKTFAQLLPERYGDTEFRTEFSSLMDHEVNRLNAIIEQINDFANLPPPAFGDLDIRDAVDEGVKLARLRTPSHDVNIEVDITTHGRLPIITGDKLALAESLAHLITNAVEATADNPNASIKLTAQPFDNGDKEEPGVEIIVSDNGPGIDPDTRTRIFSPFCSTKERPMGLGLPIVQRTASNHGGSVTVDSDDKGTCVKITLSANQQNGETSHEASADH